MSSFRSFAIIPAAGQSRRMERPKLLLEWHGSTVIEHVLRAWTSSRVTRVIVVVRDNDHKLKEVCRGADVDLVIPEQDPPDMKRSVQHALQHIEDRYDPTDSDVWLLSPADMPRISTEIIDQVILAYAREARMIVPTFLNGRSGHPVLFPWPLRSEVFALGPDEGVNAVVKRHAKTELTLDSDQILDDLDTPADYRRLRDF